MRADFGSLLDHDDRQIGIELLQPDRGGKARRPGADDDDVEFHGFARRQFFGTHDLISARLRKEGTARSFVSDFLLENNHGNAPPAVSLPRDPAYIGMDARDAPP